MHLELDLSRPWLRDDMLWSTDMDVGSWDLFRPSAWVWVWMLASKMDVDDDGSDMSRYRDQYGIDSYEIDSNVLIHVDLNVGAGVAVFDIAIDRQKY
eukprot:m.162832 g.162832  ORF g.162832 m.162832 type:complete len:97 (+) comp31278_c1_seq45:191-481(+)